MKEFRAHGKLLVSAEYMVRYGATALALPLKVGQTLQGVRRADNRRFSWKAFRDRDPWFSADFHPGTLDILETSDGRMAAYLQRILGACLEMDPAFNLLLAQWDVRTRLEFAPEWGLGSSSTLTALLARWAGIDAMDLHFRISEGSGYDVACATATGPLTYTLEAGGPRTVPVCFDPPFASRLYFVWLGIKQPTGPHLADMNEQLNPGDADILHFNRLTEGMLTATSLSDFRVLMDEHEDRLSRLTGLEKAAARFPGLQGSVKSLGAWGGDFVLVASDQDRNSLYNYLDQMGFHTRFSFKELVYGK